VTPDVIVAATIVRIAGPRTRDIVQLARSTWDWKSTVQSAIEDLTAREVLVRRVQNTTPYDFDDPFFRRWIQLNAAPGSGFEQPPRLDPGEGRAESGRDSAGERGS
jgi:hypothetical protein